MPPFFLASRTRLQANILGVMTRRDFVASAIALTMPQRQPQRKWPLGLNTYCLRFQRWNDRQLMDYCASHKLDAVFLQDSLDPGVMNPKHWTEVRAWSKELGFTWRRAAARSFRSPLRLSRIRSQRYGRTSSGRPRWDRRLYARSWRPTVTACLHGPVEKHMETTVKLLRKSAAR